MCNLCNGENTVLNEMGIKELKGIADSLLISRTGKETKEELITKISQIASI